MYTQVLTTLRSRPDRPSGKNLQIEVLSIEGAADARLHQFATASDELEQASGMCQASPEPTCGDVMRSLGVLALQKGEIDSAKSFFTQSLEFARAHSDNFLEETALLNLGATYLGERHFDEAIDWTTAAYQASTAFGADGVAQGALGNLGWAYFNLGDSEKSLEFSLKAEDRTSRAGNLTGQLYWATNVGYVYAELGDFVRARGSYLRALDLATQIKAREGIYNAQRALALLSVETGDLDAAQNYSDQAITIAKSDNNRLDELYPLLVKGMIASRQHNDPEAERIFREVDSDENDNAALHWRSEHALAQLYEDEGHSDAAEREYRIALATFESARSSLQRNDSKLPFSNNASRIYDDYIHFLVSHGKTEEALRWADYGRARTLSEGLGLLTHQSAAGLPPLNPQQIARQANGTVLFYWLGEKQSYMWAIAAQKTSLFTLPPRAEIEAAVKRYSKSLGGPRDVLAAADPDGLWLYRNLIAPTQGLPQSAAQEGARVLIIPDGNLNNLNFETLLVPAPNSSAAKLHYWIEDVTISNASSLRVLAASHIRPSHDLSHNLAMERRASGHHDSGPETVKQGQARLLAVQYQPRSRTTDEPASMHSKLLPAQLQPRSGGIGKRGRVVPGGGGTTARVPSGTAPRALLLIGNSVSPNGKYPELPKAGTQMESVAHHFSSSTEQIFAREQATPAAYLDGHPERFSYIHFVAHGTASRLSPLDSAIVLSKTVLVNADPPQTIPNTTAPSAISAETDSFKLYARDIIRHPLQADLVTISACYGAGERAYSGEGLVGLSWAFLRAGAHNVVAALWEASDASTEQLMDKFYDELNQGAPPDVALRTAKLSLLRASNFHNPFYWAPFQLYAGS
jgi:CHAT domain-containing protein/Flp pilus assembly protein TadD